MEFSAASYSAKETQAERPHHREAQRPSRWASSRSDYATAEQHRGVRPAEPDYVRLGTLHVPERGLDAHVTCPS